MTIADRVTDRRRTVEIGIGHKVERAVRIDRHRPLTAARCRHRQRITIHIAVIAKDVDVVQRGVFVGHQHAVVNRDRRIVASGDRDGQCAGGVAALTIGDRVGEGFVDGLASLEGQHGRVGIVQRVAMAAIPSHLQAAKTAGEACPQRRAAADRAQCPGRVCKAGDLNRITIDIPVLRPASRRQIACNRARAGSNRGDIRDGDRRIIGTDDGDCQRGEPGNPLIVPHCIRKGIRCGRAGSQRLHRRIGIIELVAVATVGVQGQGTEAARHATGHLTDRRAACGAAGHTGNRQYGTVVRIAVVEQYRTGGRRWRILDDGVGIRLHQRGIIGTRNDDGQRRIDKLAPAIADRVDEDIADRLAGFQGLNRRQRVVERVGITAIGVDGQRTEIAAVAGADGARWNGGVGAADIADRQRIAIRIGIRRGGNGRTGAAARDAQAGDDIAAGTGLLFGNRIAVIVRRRCVVGPVNGEGHGSGAGAAQTVTDGVGKGIGTGIAGEQAPHHRIGLIDIVGEGAIRIQPQGAKASAGVATDGTGPASADRGHVQGRSGIGIAVVDHQIAADRCSSGEARGIELVVDRNGWIVRPDDFDRQCRRRGSALAIADGVGEDLVACFPRAQRLNHRIGGVQGIAVAAIRVQRQAPEAAGEWCSRCRGYAA